MKTSYLLALFLTAAVAPAAMGIPIIVTTQTAGASYSDGGEFTVVTTPLTLLGLPDPNGGPGFQTFCIESGVDITPGAPAYYTLTQTDHSGNSLTLGAAWLFSQFSAGILSGYDYTLGSGRETSAANLQAAIWILQGQTLASPFVGLGASYVGLATAATSGNEYNPSIGAYGVDILNSTDAQTGQPSQDLLGVTNASVPDGGESVALLSFALGGVEFMRRKLASKNESHLLGI